MAPVAPRTGDAIFANIERVNAELFTLTYGAIVRQLLTDLEEVDEVNKQLDQMYVQFWTCIWIWIWPIYFHRCEFYCSVVCIFRGYNIGIRLIDEFLAKSNVSRCVDFRETADVIAKVLSYCFVSLGIGFSVSPKWLLLPPWWNLSKPIELQSLFLRPVVVIHSPKLKLETKECVCRLKKWVGDRIMKMGPLCWRRWW